MKPETAMNQASKTAMEYFDKLDTYVKAAYPKLTDEKRLDIVSRLCVSASLDYLAASVSGELDGSALSGFLVQNSPINVPQPDL